MAAFTTPDNEQDFQKWLSARGFTENPFAPDEWNDLALYALLLHRLSHCSHGRISQWEELLQAGGGKESLAPLLTAANGSPQNLLQLCDALLRHLAAQGKETVTAGDISAVLAEHQAREPSPETPSANVPPQTGLFMDLESGHVWIDQEQLLPPLTDQEYALLRILYTATPEIIDCETLIGSIWPENCSQAGDEQNLRKLISRLRRRLEPGNHGNDWRFIRSTRGRGYWLHLAIED